VREGGVDESRGRSKLIVWIQDQRPRLTAPFLIAGLALALVDDREPISLLRPDGALFGVAWALIVIGGAVRLWGAGNLRKNAEITRTGIYRMVRHPLYLGSLAIFLAFFLTVGNPWAGAALFIAMVLLVYYPTMLGEERHLSADFPDQAVEWRATPRLLPDPRNLPDALRTDRFKPKAALRNLGVSTFAYLLLLPALLELLRWVESRL
jgi:protein-S-isoprenylcysteine O-methyltransferase Ste14